MTPLDAIREVLDEEIRSWERRQRAIVSADPETRRLALLAMDILEMAGPDHTACENAIRALRHFETALGTVGA